MPSPAYNWSGFYAGINAGWAGSNANAGITVGGTSFDVTQSLDGMIGGVQAGYNWQYNYLLVGLEADIQASSQQNDFTRSASGVTASLANSIPWFATGRGRIGFAFDQWLLYGTGGVVVASVKTEGWATVSGVTQSIRVYEPQASWVLGLGVETALWASPWTLKGEWLYISSIDFSSNWLGLTTRSEANNSILRLGLNYRFGQPSGPPRY